MKTASIENGGIKIINNYLFLVTGIFATFISVAGAVLLFNLIFDAQLMLADVFGIGVV